MQEQEPRWDAGLQQEIIIVRIYAEVNNCWAAEVQNQQAEFRYIPQIKIRIKQAASHQQMKVKDTCVDSRMLNIQNRLRNKSVANGRSEAQVRLR